MSPWPEVPCRLVSTHQIVRVQSGAAAALMLAAGAGADSSLRFGVLWALVRVGSLCSFLRTSTGVPTRMWAAPGPDVQQLWTILNLLRCDDLRTEYMHRADPALANPSSLPASAVARLRRRSRPCVGAVCAGSEEPLCVAVSGSPRSTTTCTASAGPTKISGTGNVRRRRSRAVRTGAGGHARVSCRDCASRFGCVAQWRGDWTRRMPGGRTARW